MIDCIFIIAAESKFELDDLEFELECIEEDNNKFTEQLNRHNACST